MADGDPPAQAPNRLAELRTSARGWHGVQLAVLGFIGFCGVLQKGRPDNPMWVQVLASILALAALALACAAAFQVGRVAWPLYSGRPSSGAGEPAELAKAARQLRSGLVLTFVAIAMLALATASGWWPQDEAAGGLVEVRAADGQTWCGTLGEAQAGALSVQTDAGPVTVGIPDLASVRPVSRCG